MMLIPATILTGFLGSGKTTLLKRVLTENHGLRVAVIENEFGEENIDSEILISETKEHIIQMTNGCICCTIREDLRTALQELADKRHRGELNFDRVVIETTGIADPGPVAQTFFMNDQIAQCYQLDSVLTLVDAKHAEQTLTDRQEARRQVGFADHLFISKSELVSLDCLEALQHRLRHMNPRALQRKVHFGEVPINEVFDLHAFNLDATLELSPEFLTEAKSGRSCGHQHAPGEVCDQPEVPRHNHNDDIKSFVFHSDRAFHSTRLGHLMGAMVNSYGSQMLRYKGVLHMHGFDRKVIFQGVHQLMSSDAGVPWGPEEKRTNTMVFIGIQLPKETIVRCLNQCLV